MHHSLCGDISYFQLNKKKGPPPRQRYANFSLPLFASSVPPSCSFVDRERLHPELPRRRGHRRRGLQGVLLREASEVDADGVPEPAGWPGDLPQEEHRQVCVGSAVKINQYFIALFCLLFFSGCWHSALLSERCLSSSR